MVEAVLESKQTRIFHWLKYNICARWTTLRAKIGYSNRCCVVPFHVTVSPRSPSQCRSERLLDVLRKRIDHSAFVVTLICPEEPAVNERVDLAKVKFDHITAKGGPTSCPAAPHPLCRACPGDSGIDRHTVGRCPIIPMFSVMIIAASLYQIALVAARITATAVGGDIRPTPIRP